MKGEGITPSPSPDKDRLLGKHWASIDQRHSLGSALRACLLYTLYYLYYQALNQIFLSDFLGLIFFSNLAFLFFRFLLILLVLYLLNFSLSSPTVLSFSLPPLSLQPSFLLHCFSQILTLLFLLNLHFLLPVFIIFFPSSSS